MSKEDTSKNVSEDNELSVSSVSDQKRNPEDTRSVLANIYVLGFLGIILVVLILSFLKGFKTADVKDLLLTVSGVLSGPLGFIIGYYFKSKEG